MTLFIFISFSFIGPNCLFVKQENHLTKATWIRVSIMIRLAFIRLRAPVTERQEGKGIQKCDKHNSPVNNRRMDED